MDHRRVQLPDQVTVLTCIGCGAMGRQERCEGSCSEHRLLLVGKSDLDALSAAEEAARDRLQALLPSLAALDDPVATENTLPQLQEAARRALQAAPPAPDPRAWADPEAVTGWWCAECGNVDLPSPCIGVCVWQPAEWVSLAHFDRELDRARSSLEPERTLSRFLTRVTRIRPRPGQAQRNWDALRAEGLAVSRHSP